MPSPAIGEVQIELWTSYAAWCQTKPHPRHDIPADYGSQHFPLQRSISSNCLLVRGRLPKPNKIVGVMTALNIVADLLLKHVGLSEHT